MSSITNTAANGAKEFTKIALLGGNQGRIERAWNPRPFSRPVPTENKVAATALALITGPVGQAVLRSDIANSSLMHVAVKTFIGYLTKA